MTLRDAQRLAYRATCYRIHAPGGDLQLRIDRCDAGLARLLRDAGVHTAAILTAWNPRSESRPRAGNIAAQDTLRRTVSEAGYASITGINEPDASSAREAWTEPSVLVLGITRAAAQALAVRHQQNAFVWIEADGTPRLQAAAV